MKFTKIPSTTFQELQMNAGILATGFTPATGTLESADMLGATSGGVNFKATPTYSDFGDDIDNCPKNMMELKQLDSWDIKMSGTFVTVRCGKIPDRPCRHWQDRRHEGDAQKQPGDYGLRRYLVGWRLL